MVSRKKVMMAKRKKVEAVKLFGRRVCRVCDGGKLERLAELPEQEYAGILADGKKFTSITRERVRCECGQVSVVMLHKFDPSKWQD